MKVFAILYATISRTTRVSFRIPAATGTLFRKMQVVCFHFIFILRIFHYPALAVSIFVVSVVKNQEFRSCIFKFVLVVAEMLWRGDNRQRIRSVKRRRTYYYI